MFYFLSDTSMDEIWNTAENLWKMNFMKNTTEISDAWIEENEERIFKYDLQLSSPEELNFFEILRNVRLQLAQKYGRAPFQILDNKTLRLLVACKPTTKEQMLKIYGIKEVKYQQFWEVFLEAIRNQWYGISDFVDPENFINPLRIEKQISPHTKTYQKKDERRWEEVEKKISKMQNLGLKNEDIKVWLDSYYELEKAKEFQKYQEILLNIQEKINALKAKIGIMD